MKNKNALRQALRKKRSALTHGEIHAKSHSAVMHFIHSPLFKNNEYFACYLAQDNEIETSLFFEYIFQQKKKCYLPHLDKDHMNFASYELGDELIPNQYNILEPVVTGKNHRDAKDMDVILAPLVGFDDQGNRLGMGGGFYDRTLAFLHHKQHDNPSVVGLAFDCQRADAIPTEAWDVRLDAVLTENGLHFF